MGANVLVAYGLEDDEAPNQAVFTLYSEENTDGPTAVALGNTVPSDAEDYATIAPGLYSADRVIYKRRPALAINNRGAVPTVSSNPNPNSNYHGQMFADRIYVHIGNKGPGRYNMFTRDDRPISQGCPTVFHGSTRSYQNFIRHFPDGWTGNFYLLRY